MKKIKLREKFPYIKFFRDYHEVKWYADTLNEIFATKIKAIEGLMGNGYYGDGYYYGIFYISKKPSKKIIKQLCS